MARKAFNDRRKSISESVAKMLVHYLQSKVFPELGPKELAERTGITQSVINVPWFQDIPEICEGAGLDIGLTVRDAKGHEVTFWPPENFSEGYQPPKMARKPLPPLPPAVGVHQHHPRHEFLDRRGTDFRGLPTNTPPASSKHMNGMLLAPAGSLSIIGPGKVPSQGEDDNGFAG